MASASSSPSKVGFWSKVMNNKNSGDDKNEAHDNKEKKEPAEPTKKKLPKSQRLAEARARAREWAKGETTNKNKTVKKEKDTPKNNNESNKTKAAKIAEARASARAWAAREEAKQNDKSAARSSKEAATKHPMEEGLETVSPIKKVNIPPSNIFADAKVGTSFSFAEDDNDETADTKNRTASLKEETETVDDKTMQHVRILLQSCDRHNFETVFENLQQLVGPVLTKEAVVDLYPSGDELATLQLVQLCGYDQISSLQALPGVDKAWLKQQSGFRHVLTAWLSTVFWSVYDFFHARIKIEHVQRVGYMRIAYALLFLYSRGWLFRHELPFLMDPQTGVMPYRSTKHTLYHDDYSLFQYFPHSPELVYALGTMGLVNGILLLLGIAPRLQAMGIFFFYYQFQNHNSILSDYQDVMMRMYALMLALAPLHHVTVWDGFGISPKKTGTTSSWPMWPIRIWQLLVCLVYLGAGYGKLSSDVWFNGEALYYPPYEEGFGRFWNPDFIFNRLGPIKLLTWSTLLLECTCMFLIWPKATRKLTFFGIVGLHTGIELTMIMHIFQYISVLGWCSFLIQPSHDSRQAIKPRRQRRVIVNGKRFLLETAVAFFLMYAFVADTLPTAKILSCMQSHPTFVKDWFRSSVHRPVRKARLQLYPFLKLTGLHMGEWTLFGGIPTHENHRYTAVIRFQNTSDVQIWQSPNWSNATWLERELMVWSDSYYYYIWNSNDAETSFPILTTFMEHLARTYSTKGAIEYMKAADDDSSGQLHGERLKIYPNNTIRSISLWMHQETGKRLKTSTSKSLNWWTDPVRLPTVKSSECIYNWKFPKSHDTIQYKSMRYTLLEDLPLDVQTGCRRYNETDTIYHMVGSYD